LCPKLFCIKVNITKYKPTIFNEIKINTYSNKEQGWEGDEDWSLQLHYKKLYNTEKQDIKVIVSGPMPVIEYKPDNKNQINVDNLYKHYNGFLFYGVYKY